MDFNELWIGDLVWVKSKGQNGKWEGPVGQNTAKVKIGHHHMVVPLSDLDSPREEATPQFSPKKSTTIKEAISFNSNVLDLHIETLAPNRNFQTPEQIIMFQLKKCRQFVEYYIDRRQHSITVIHGKGTGALKSEVLHLLKDYPQVYHTIPTNNGGAVEVWFQYR